jgi:hypothetical protein
MAAQYCCTTVSGVGEQLLVVSTFTSRVVFLH